MSDNPGRKYYKKYRNDPNFTSTTPNHTQEQIKEFISFIVDDKMTVEDASEKANMSLETGKIYYQQYLNVLYRDIPTPTHVARNRYCSEEQVNTLIRCIVDDKMSVSAASIKANMSATAASRYYRKYINDLNNDVPTHITHHPPCTQEQVTTLICCIVQDKMSVANASKKANISKVTGHRYYNQLVRDRQQ